MWGRPGLDWGSQRVSASRTRSGGAQGGAQGGSSGLRVPGVLSSAWRTNGETEAGARGGQTKAGARGAETKRGGAARRGSQWAARGAGRGRRRDKAVAKAPRGESWPWRLLAPPRTPAPPDADPRPQAQRRPVRPAGGRAEVGGCGVPTPSATPVTPAGAPGRSWVGNGGPPGGPRGSGWAAPGTAGPAGSPAPSPSPPSGCNRR